MWTFDKVNLSISRVPFVFLEALKPPVQPAQLRRVTDAGETRHLVRDNLRLSRVVDQVSAGTETNAVQSWRWTLYSVAYKLRSKTRVSVQLAVCFGFCCQGLCSMQCRI